MEDPLAGGGESAAVLLAGSGGVVALLAGDGAVAAVMWRSVGGPLCRQRGVPKLQHPDRARLREHPQRPQTWPMGPAQ